MDTRIKNILGIAGTAAIITLIYGIIAYTNSFSRSIPVSSVRSFAVNGEGKSVSIPDIAEFHFGIITQGGKDISKLQNDNADKMNKIIGFLKSNNIDSKDIATENYNVEPRYQYYNCKSGGVCPPAEIVGYTITQNISVKARDFGKAGDLLSGVVKNGANSVSQLTFDIDNKSKFENDARAKAINQAQEKAKGIAQAGGFKLGKLLSIEEAPNAYPIYYSAFKETAGMGGAVRSAPSIEPGSKEIRSNVILRYEIK